MATESDIRGAERARLEGLVREHGTERDQFELVFSGVMRGGITQAQYEGLEPVGYLPPDPELLGRLAQRAERRMKSGLPARECVGDPQTSCCRCLERALDESGDDGRRAILRRARGFHWSPPPRRERVGSDEATSIPQEALAGPQEANGRVEEAPQPKPTPEPEKPHRVVHRTPKWFDAERRFSDTKF